jgi:Raf kinase inhibitor-like YbhB/YbcL family protein
MYARHRRTRRGLLARAALLSVAMIVGLATASKEATVTLRITSSAFADGAEIPAEYTCEGKDISPPLAWSGVPAGTTSLVLIVDDPDAPDPKAPRMTWVHWVLYNLPPSSTGLPEAVGAALPSGTKVGFNDWKRADFGGPCPPIGRHRYFHKLYALDTELNLTKPAKVDVEAAMRGHVLAEAQLMGTYQKAR